MRFNATSGLLDTAGFNAGGGANAGRQIIAFNTAGNNDDRAFDVQVAQNNDILLAGYATVTAADVRDFAVARLISTGTAANFGTAGKRTIDTAATAGGADEARSLAVAGTGASEVIYIGGFAAGTDGEDFAMVKIPGNGNGTVGEFGNSGIKLQDFRSGINSNERLNELRLQGGSIVAVGFSAQTLNNFQHQSSTLNLSIQVFDPVFIIPVTQA